MFLPKGEKISFGLKRDSNHEKEIINDYSFTLPTTLILFEL